MNKSFSALAATLALCAAGVAHADEFPVRGSNTSGQAGDVVFLDITYSYGTGFDAMIEDLVVLYPASSLTFLTNRSTIDTLVAGQSLDAYFDALQSFARDNGGNVSINPSAGEFRLSYYTDGSAGQRRIGEVKLQAAFMIADGTPAGDYTVSFGGDNYLYDLNENEFTYPEAMQNLRVTVLSAVAEPAMALLLLPGLALVGWQARRRNV